MNWRCRGYHSPALPAAGMPRPVPHLRRGCWATAASLGPAPRPRRGQAAPRPAAAPAGGFPASPTPSRRRCISRGRTVPWVSAAAPLLAPHSQARGERRARPGATSRRPARPCGLTWSVRTAPSPPRCSCRRPAPPGTALPRPPRPPPPPPPGRPLGSARGRSPPSAPGRRPQLRAPAPRGPQGQPAAAGPWRWAAKRAGPPAGLSPAPPQQRCPGCRSRLASPRLASSPLPLRRRWGGAPRSTPPSGPGPAAADTVPPQRGVRRGGCGTPGQPARLNVFLVGDWIDTAPISTAIDLTDKQRPSFSSPHTALRRCVLRNSKRLCWGKCDFKWWGWDLEIRKPSEQGHDWIYVIFVEHSLILHST